MNWAWPTILFTQTISTVLFGRMSDLIGRRYIFLFGNLVAFVGFLAGGRVKEPATATGLSALIGIGTGVQILAPFLNLAELVPIRHRFVMSGACMSCFAPLLAMSPAIAEAFYKNTGDTWRWCYSFNAILSFVALVLAALFYFPPTFGQLHEGLPVIDELKKKDWVGLVALTTFISTLQFVLMWGIIIYPWSSAQTIAVTTISGAGLVLFVG